MKYIKEYAFSALAILMASCSSDSDTIEPEAQKPPVASSGTMSFSASIESGEAASKATRTSLADANTDSPYPIWSSGDQIKVLNTATSDAQLFSITSSDVGKRAANFTGNIKVETGNNANNKFYAFYAGNVGASEGAPTISMSGSNVTVSGTIPSTQSSTPGFHPELHFMTACTTGSAFSFKNGMALMKVTIADNNYNNFKICKIVLKSNNESEAIAGDFTADIANTNKEATKEDPTSYKVGDLINYTVTNGSSEIVIDNGTTPLPTGTYYIAILPCAFSNGFTLSFVDCVIGNYGDAVGKVVDLSQYDRIKSTSFNVAASEIINLGTYTAKECAKEAYVDLGIGPLFCVENVYDDNANSPVNASYYSWGETLVKANQEKNSDDYRNYSWYYNYNFSTGSQHAENLKKRCYKYGVGATNWNAFTASESYEFAYHGYTGVLLKYNDNSSYTQSSADWTGGSVDNDSDLDLEDDVAYQNSPQHILRMASEDDFKALINNSGRGASTILLQAYAAGSNNTVYKFLNKETGRYLLVPIGGYRFMTSESDHNNVKYGVGSDYPTVYYWSRTRTKTTGNDYKAKALKVVATSHNNSIVDIERAAGLLVRGVIDRSINNNE